MFNFLASSKWADQQELAQEIVDHMKSRKGDYIMNAFIFRDEEGFPLYEVCFLVQKDEIDKQYYVSVLRSVKTMGRTKVADVWKYTFTRPGPLQFIGRFSEHYQNWHGAVPSAMKPKSLAVHPQHSQKK
ncbi:hypothetical protein SCHPADRAFT_888949 [Schizopora paradoxa]|uniref:Uncharacterized protein n=1 Tax=Schizopora paradoxa TaxID=27342 RepID=A0A0H2RSZ6_9AGAM|nr:hypothetical protein SCHPADRAFT_888949 [Schizopora paradoxa]